MIDLRSSNDQYRPAKDALKLIERHKDSSFTTYHPLGDLSDDVPACGTVLGQVRLLSCGQLRLLALQLPVLLRRRRALTGALVPGVGLGFRDHRRGP
ncbi:hypothetical protein NOSIN_09355 [Nocardiopsis sinuspersici]|uniref:Uncharacterized protein n=1 Tax=Nocardiopsis sinuspersici TaxID=501010 RepID=A0A1V3BZU6_9ACTN|nr:hypothetical protein NOSIN_09355 [Nocardiopsis sinuspersici]